MNINGTCKEIFQTTPTAAESSASISPYYDCKNILIRKHTNKNTIPITTPEEPAKPMSIVDIVVDQEIAEYMDDTEISSFEEKNKIKDPVNIDKSFSSIDDSSETKAGSKSNAAPSINNKRKSDYQVESNIDEKKVHNMRKNIRGVINEKNFDRITINAQREESERLARVQGLKKLVKHKYLHSTLDSMVEGVQVEDNDFLTSGETIDKQQVIKRTNISLNQSLQRFEEKKSEKKLWNQLFCLDPSSKTKEEVVTIDSSSDDDDDCIILSDSDDCLDDEAEDHHNSGLHVKDVLNIPNEYGKVMVNVGHAENEPDIFLAPQIAKIIKPHQIGGVRFLFDNIIESTKRFNNSSGFGCILAHSMGLGKTLQVVSFSDIFLTHTDSKTILCVMPINTIQNWVKEYNLWLPEQSLNHEEVRPRSFKVFALNDQHKTMSSRSKVIARWHTEGGVLLIGYELFRVLGLKIIKQKDSKKALDNSEHKRLLDNMHSALVKPGPDLVICDEGHRIKNAHAGISIALKQIRSRRRIVLTGYPLQNNLLEYWCMVDFVRPNYLGSKTEFCNMFERPIQNGQCIDSTPEDIKLMRYRAHVLHSLLVGFVQRRSDSVLQNSLPRKLEYVILAKMTKFQRQLYDAFMNEVVRKKKVPNPLKAFAVCCKIWNHPDVLYNFMKKRETDLDLDIEEQDTAIKSTFSEKPNDSNKNANESAPPNAYGNETFATTKKETQNLFSSEKNKNNNLWQDREIISVDGHHPKLIGMFKNSLTDDIKPPSEIVDLDTKEVQFVKSDLEFGSIQNSKKNEQNKTNLNLPTAGSCDSNINNKPGKIETKSGNDTISYDWALTLLKDYKPGIVSTSPKMQIFLYILEESIKLGDRVLVFSQSLLTLNVMELFLQSLLIPQTENYWKKNISYFRLDGSTSSLEREKLVNEFNSNNEVKLFLISTRAGSLGINLTGANRVVVFDASWNPCHDTQAVHRIYRYGQGKSCYVYRIVMDNCLEKNIYDRQVKKQGMSDRVVDECNPDAHLSIRELTNLCYDKEEEIESNEFKQPIENYSDEVMRSMLRTHKSILSKEPFYHESLLIDRKEKKLSQTEKKLAKRGYEIEKRASSKTHHFIHNAQNIAQNRDCFMNKVNTNQVFKNRINEPFKNPTMKLTRWIPAEVWQRQGMSSQEMKLPIDVAIPTNSNESSSIVVKAGEKVMVLNSAKGVYMQLESGKIIAIKTSSESKDKIQHVKKPKNQKMNEKMALITLDTVYKEDASRAGADQASGDSENDDCIVINENIDYRSENSFNMSCTGLKNHVDPTAIKKQSILKAEKHTSVVKEDGKERELLTKNNQFCQDKPDSKIQGQTFCKSKPETITQSHHFSQTKLDPVKPTNQFRRNKQEAQAQSYQYQQDKPEAFIQNSQMPQARLIDPLLQTHQDFQDLLELEASPSVNYVDKQPSYLHRNTVNYSNYGMILHHNMENQHFPTLSTPKRWENKSPELFKPSFKISNIPAPYPSTAVCDLAGFDKIGKLQQSIPDSINVEQYNLPPYTSIGKDAKDPSYHHNVNFNLQYQDHNPHSAIQLPPNEENGLLDAMYHLNNKNENSYSDNSYENSNASHSNHHPQMSKYLYAYDQPQFLSNYPNSNNSKKIIDNNAFSTVSSQYYIRRPSSFSENSPNRVDVGFNYTEPQGWMKNHIPQ